MSHRFLISLKKWPLATQKALSILNEASQYGETRIVDFQFGPPSDGILPFRLFIDGRRALLCELSDTSPSFLRKLREWMERCLVMDQEGVLHPELLTLDLRGLVLSIVLIHVGWDEVQSRAKPISFLVVIRSDMAAPTVCCFCDTLDTISGLYKAILVCLRQYRSRFDRAEFWYDVKRYDRLNPIPTTERMLSEIRSKKIEKVALYQKMHIL
jgi:hypothetical protein